MSQRFFHKKYALISIIALTSLCCYAQEAEITSSPKYYDRSVINRILVKEQLENNKSTKLNITNTQEGPITQPDEPSGKIYKSTSFGACDIFDKDEQASFTISLKNAVEMSLSNNIALNIEKIDPEIYATSVEQAKAEFLQIAQDNIKRDGVDKLLEYLQKSDFFN